MIFQIIKGYSYRWFVSGLKNDNFITDTGSYVYVVTFTDGFRGVPADLKLVFDITLSNGCTYTGRINTHAILPIDGNQTTDTTVENGD